MSNRNMKRKIISMLLSLTLLTGCANDFVSMGPSSRAGYDSSPDSSSVTSSATDSGSDAANQAIQQMNQQMAVDAANAAAQQQFNDSMAAQQLFENQHNDEFNANGLH